MSSAVPIGRLAPGTDEWTAARRRRIGGSEIGAILGISPYESRFSLWHRKRGEIDPVEQTEPMLWGTLLEPVVAARFATLHPEWFVRTTPAFVHSDRPYQTAAPDRLLFGTRRARRPRAIYEGKTDRLGDEWGEQGTDEIPPHYAAQCRWYLDCLGLDVCHVAVLVGGSDYREYVIRHDEAEAALMRQAAVEFVASLDAGPRPSIDEHAATYQTVKELHPGIDGSAVEVAPEIAQGYAAACADEKTAKDAKRRAAALLADAMGDAREAWCAGRKVALRVPGTAGAPPHLRPAKTSRKDAAA